MGGRCPEGHIADHRNTRMEETSRRQRRKEASSEGGQGPERAVATWMDGWMVGWMDGWMDGWMESFVPIYIVWLVTGLQIFLLSAL